MKRNLLLACLSVTLPLLANNTFAGGPPPNWKVYAEGETVLDVESGISFDTFGGRSSHLGKFTGEGTHVANFQTGAFDGFATYTAASGDQLYVIYQGQITSVDPEAEYMLQGVAQFQVVGGTGRLENATGSADAIGGFTGFTGDFFFELEGTLDPQGK